MIATKAKHPNCMLMWMDHMMSAEANGQATVWFGEAPTSPQACDVAEKLSPGHCEQTHADGRGLLRQDLVLDHPDRPTAPTPTRRPRARPRTTGSQAWTKLRGA